MADIRLKTILGKWRDALADRLGVLFVKAAPGGYLYIGQQQVTSTDGTANSLTVPPGATSCNVHVTAGDIYFDFRGGSSTPSSTVGDTAAVGDDIPIYGPRKMADLRAVRQTGTNFTLKVIYFGDRRDE